MEWGYIQKEHDIWGVEKYTKNEDTHREWEQIKREYMWNKDTYGDGIYIEQRYTWKVNI